MEEVSGSFGSALAIVRNSHENLEDEFRDFVSDVKPNLENWVTKDEIKSKLEVSDMHLVILKFFRNKKQF